MRAGHMNRLTFATVGIVMGIDSWNIQQVDKEFRWVRTYPSNILYLAVWASRSYNVKTYGEFWSVLQFVQYDASLFSPPMRMDYIKSLKPRVEKVREAIEAGTPVPHVRDHYEIEEVLRKLQKRGKVKFPPKQPRKKKR